LIEFALFDAIDEPLDLGRISSADVIIAYELRTIAATVAAAIAS
jgi:hypothetical protein